MSLFKARQWWATRCGSEEEFDRGCLCVANVDNEPDGSAKIVTGSFQGMLRIYKPTTRDFQASHLIIEQQLGAPVLQIEAGRFLPGMKGALGLAVLHPRKISVYAVVQQQQNEEWSQYALERRYEHALERTSFNFTYGPFAGVYDRDFLCVQSMDGMLSFFEQDVFAFSRFISGFLLPGPICYVAKADAFVVSGSAMNLECYKYQTLATATAAEEKRKEQKEGEAAAPEANSLITQKRLMPEWTLNVGECVSDMFPARFSRALTTSQVDVVVVGEHTLLCVKDNGSAVRSQRRLEYAPAAAAPYSPSPEDTTANDNLIICSHDPATLMVYRDAPPVQLAWAARMSSVPVSVKVAPFGGVPGMIVTLDTVGQLSVQYLGTEPSMTMTGPPASELRELNYAEMDAEMRQLESTIKEISGATRTEPTDKVVMYLADLSVTAPTAEESEAGGMPTAYAKLLVSFAGAGGLMGVQISVNAEKPISAEQKLLALDTIMGNAPPTLVPLSFHSTTKCCPTSLSVIFVATYLSPKGEPRTARYEHPLPLTMVCKMTAPTKNAQHKIIIDTNRQPAAVRSLFADIDTAPDTVAAADKASAVNVTAFKFYSGPEVAIMGSKSSGRYRIQSDDFGAMWIVLSSFATRLTEHFRLPANGGGAEANEPFRISYQEKTLPFTEYFEVVDAHFSARKSLIEATHKLEQCAFQFRAVEKRLLVRFKDRNAVPLDNLDILLDRTYATLMSLSTEVQSKQRDLTRASVSLSASTRLIHQLIKYRFDLDETNFLMLQNYFPATVEDKDEQGWEEMVDTAIVQALRTVLTASGGKDVPLAQPMQAPQSTQRLKNNIMQLFDRLGQGNRFHKATTKAPPTSSKHRRQDTSEAGDDLNSEDRSADAPARKTQAPADAAAVAASAGAIVPSARPKSSTQQRVSRVPSEGRRPT